MQFRISLLLIWALISVAGSFLPAQAAAEDGLAHTNKTELVELANKAKSAYAKGEYEESEKLWNEAIPIAEKTDLQSVVDCLCGLAKTKDKQGDETEADRLYEFAMRTLENHTKDQNNYLYADYLADLGDLYYRHGKLEQADLIYKKLIDIRINKMPVTNSSQNKELEIMKAEEAYANFLRATNKAGQAGIHQDKAANIRYRLQNVSE